MMTELNISVNIVENLYQTVLNISYTYSIHEKLCEGKDP